MSTLSKNVKKANKASSTSLSSSFQVRDVPSESPLSYRVAHSSDISDEDKSTVWEIFQDNMRELYINSSFGWNPPEKKSELFHKLSRFILVRPNTGGPAIAFAMFRFEHEDGEDVIYCYDIQVSSAAQGAGLGTHILEHLIGIGFKWNMQQLMLTVFKDNKRAIKLYNSLGFIIHPSSPGNFPEGEDTDYEIMSKTLLEQTN